jgi:hypothetical protein
MKGLISSVAITLLVVVMVVLGVSVAWPRMLI